MGKNKKPSTDDTALQMAHCFGSSGAPKPTTVDDALPVIEHDDLRQGSLYIVKIRNVCVALFEGWDDDMCCFSVLRSEATPMRWSEARYIPGDFDAYEAFDEAGNPPVHLWSRQLRVQVPINWFSIFEEARRKQRQWVDEQNHEQFYYAADEHGRHATHHDPVTPPATDKSSGGDDDDKSPNGSHNGNDGSSKQYAEGSQEQEPHQTDNAKVDGVVKDSDAGDSGAANGSATPMLASPKKHVSEKSTSAQAVSRSSTAAGNKRLSTAEEPSGVARSNTAPHIAKQQHQSHSKKYQATPSSNGVGSDNDIPFAHNGDQFSIQNNSYQATPSAAAPVSATANDPASIKPKRRSVHGFFRSKS